MKQEMELKINTDSAIRGAIAYQIRDGDKIVCEAFKDPQNGTVHVYAYGSTDGKESVKVKVHDKRIGF